MTQLALLPDPYTEAVMRAIDCGVPLTVREVWAVMGARMPLETARVGDALGELEAAGRIRFDGVRWEARW